MIMAEREDWEESPYQTSIRDCQIVLFTDAFRPSRHFNILVEYFPSEWVRKMRSENDVAIL